ncbi:LOW QUALITY PROTEIN: mini-chromosome maintenance complex-binding protein-like [Portunus trituberculatus]|uniref:LOW QUALITY PROTEIN: mini-chromosome maintenance complex-binding protein-like n=1 Tax=Portunus trituberculatus TaxID=210409 RepID=UPI001E1D000B|nr:LOW QUALITY PROTEIN: mini-chromosome maintenance complex-binding protein-like [Portunus trituberculatus]
MPGVNDWTLEPCKVVERIFEECGAAGPWRERVKQHFEAEVQQPAVLEKIPWLNETTLDSLRGGQLVRFRGMVQDMLGKEFFSDVYQVTAEGGDGGGSTKLLPGRYKDVVQCGAVESLDTGGPGCETGDRLVYYCIPLPGETHWVKQVYQDNSPAPPTTHASLGQARQKRPADTTERERNILKDLATHLCGLGECMETDEGEAEERKRVRGEGWGEANGGAPSTSTSTSTSTTTSSSTPELNFPLPGMKGTPALVKLYEEEGFTLNQVIEVVAVLSVSPALTAPPSPDPSPDPGSPMDLWGPGEAEGHSSAPPSLVPRLHCIAHRVMKHTNPLISSSFSSSSSSSSSAFSSSREARAVLREVLVEVCLGDEVAAEHLLCHLLSAVYGRQDVTVLGKYCVNLSGVDQDLQRQHYCRFVYQVLTSLVTQAHLLPLTLHNINKAVFVPKKNYQTDRLTSGLLQLPEHTHLVLDETSLVEGQVDRTGVANLTALGNMISWQKVDYDFQFHVIEQLTNLPVLVLSEGKSMLPSDAEIKLQPRRRDVDETEESGGTSLHCLFPSTLPLLRCYITSARQGEYVLPEDLQKVVQEDFMASRRRNESFSATDLHRLLVLARLQALSHGETQLTRELWDKTKAVENERKTRLPPPSSPSTT